MIAGGTDFKGRLLALKKEIQALGPPLDFLVLGAGGCRLCDPCAYVDREPCRRPDDAIVSLEACGIDVMRLMKDNGLKYDNGKNTVTFIGGIFCYSR
jgi:predicted metal-binding protein